MVMYRNTTLTERVFELVLGRPKASELAAILKLPISYPLTPTEKIDLCQI